jgi:flavorubredoxin
MFLETRMLHWPDSMFTYVKEDKILFSSDAFGQHYAGYEKFDDQIGDAIMFHAQKYYANILLPFAALIEKLIARIGELGLEFDMICPDHGILWRSEPAKIVEAYAKWSRQQGENKAIVLYDTMWHSTETMAEAIVAGITETGVMAKPMNARHCHRSDIITETMDAKAVIVGSSTLNNNVFPTLMDVLTYMKGLKPKNKLGAAFGSYGWSGEAVKLLNAQLESMNFELIDPGLKIQYVPDAEGRAACVEFGRKIGKAILEAGE